MNLPLLQTGLPAPGASDVSGSRSGVKDDATKIAESSRQFEAMLVRQVLADTLKPTSATGGATAPGADIYQGFVNDIIADHISEGSSLGIANLLQSQVQTSAKPHVASAHATDK